MKRVDKADGVKFMRCVWDGLGRGRLAALEGCLFEGSHILGSKGIAAEA